MLWNNLPIEAVVCVCINSCSYAYLHVGTWARSPGCMCELWVGQQRYDPCVISCESPPLPSSTANASVPLIPPKNRKAGTVFRYWLWDGIILCSTMYIRHWTQTHCMLPSAGDSLQCPLCVSYRAIQSCLWTRLMSMVNETNECTCLKQ